MLATEHGLPPGTLPTRDPAGTEVNPFQRPLQALVAALLQRAVMCIVDHLSTHLGALLFASSVTQSNQVNLRSGF
jgi:hypothetical protein